MCQAININRLTSVFHTDSIVSGYLVILIFRLIILFSVCYLPSTYALTCKMASTGALFQQITIDKSILLSRDEHNAGEIIWRSPTYSSVFECSDTDHMPQGENAYAYLDPYKEVQAINGPFEIGITLTSQGMTTDYPLSNGIKVDLGRGTMCRPGTGSELCQTPATPMQVSISYNIFIRATGAQTPNFYSGDSRQIRLFQVDGAGGLNIRPDSNYQVRLSGLNNIRYIDCEPAFAIVANQGETVEFGQVGGASAQLNKVVRRIPFFLEPRAMGSACNGQEIAVSFSSPRVAVDNMTILPENSDEFGFIIEDSDQPGKPLNMRESYSLLVLNNGVQRKKYLAGFKWLTDRAPSSSAGEFSGTANVTVTFK
jgi:P pilus assembly protein, pilin FimA